MTTLSPTLSKELIEFAYLEINPLVEASERNPTNAKEGVLTIEVPREIIGRLDVTDEITLPELQGDSGGVRWNTFEFDLPKMTRHGSHWFLIVEWGPV